MRERCYCPQLPNKIVFFYSISSVINLVWLSTRHAATRDPWIYGNSWITYNLTVGCITAPIVAHDCSRATSLDEAILSVSVADHTFGGAMRQNETPSPPLDRPLPWRPEAMASIASIASRMMRHCSVLRCNATSANIGAVCATGFGTDCFLSPLGTFQKQKSRSTASFCHISNIQIIIKMCPMHHHWRSISSPKHQKSLTIPSDAFKVNQICHWCIISSNPAKPIEFKLAHLQSSHKQ